MRRDVVSGIEEHLAEDLFVQLDVRVDQQARLACKALAHHHVARRREVAVVDEVDRVRALREAHKRVDPVCVRVGRAEVPAVVAVQVQAAGGVVFLDTKQFCSIL